MSKLVLTSEGVFPVVKGIDGKVLNDLPQTGLQIPGTIQGEGKLTGVPSLFIRLSGCNLRCIWKMKDGSLCRCDTSYSSFQPVQNKTISVDDILLLLKHNIGTLKHVVITGGEPLRQKKPLVLLCQKIKEELNLHITLETNGTLFDRDVAQWVDLFSISPKLGNSDPNTEKLSACKLRETDPFRVHASQRINLEVLQAFIDLCNSSDKDIQLKFVVGLQNEDVEIKNDYLDKLNDYDPNDILLMPLGATREEIAQSAPVAMQMAIANGWRYCPRVHVDLFGSKQGV